MCQGKSDEIYICPFTFSLPVSRLSYFVWLENSNNIYFTIFRRKTFRQPMFL